MKIDDLSITLFTWNDIPPHSYLGRGPFDPAGRPNRTGEQRRGVRRAGAVVPGRGLAGLQDPSVPHLAGRHADLPGRA